MITPKLSFEPRERTPYTDAHAYFHPAFFKGEMRRSWPKIICYTLLLFFVLPLPLLFEGNSRHWEAAKLSGSLTSMINDVTWLYCFATVAIALFAGMLATVYLCRRPSVDFYHSLPIRREGLLIQSWLCGMLQFVTALVFNVLLSMLIVFSTVGQITLIGAPIGKLMIAAGYMLLTYLLFYTLTVFCGMLCGTSFMQIVVTGLALGAFPLFRVLALAFCNMVTDTVDVGHYFDSDWGWTSPLIRLVYLAENDNVYYNTPEGVEYVRYGLENPFTVWEILLWIVAAVALFLGAMWLYRKRHVERAGTPVVFEGVAAAVKWVVIVLATMAMGWLFGEIGGSAAWLFFGFLLGGFLSFMLINTILTKNPKQMFRGWKAIVVYLVAFCIGSVGIGYAVSEIEDIVPERVDRVAIYIANDNYSVPYYTDPVVIEAWQELWREEMWKDTHYNAAETVVFDTYAMEKDPTLDGEVVQHSFASRRISIRAYAQIGPFVIPYRTRNVERSSAEALIRAVTDSAEFEAGWDGMMASLAGKQLYDEDEYWHENYAHVTMLTLFGDLYREHAGHQNDNTLYHGSPIPLRADVLAAMVAEMPDDISFDFFQNPAYVSVEADWLERAYDEKLSYRTSPNNYWFQYRVGTNSPVFYRDTLGLDEQGFYEALADIILRDHGGLYVAKRVSGYFLLSHENARLITDRGQIIEILRALSNLGYDSWELSPFTVTDEEFGVIYPNATSTGVTYFIKGKTPAFVKDIWG